MEYAYERQEHFLVHRYFFVFPNQYELLGLHVSAVGEGGFESTPAKVTHGIFYPNPPDYYDGTSSPETV